MQIAAILLSFCAVHPLVHCSLSASIPPEPVVDLGYGLWQATVNVKDLIQVSSLLIDVPTLSRLLAPTTTSATYVMLKLLPAT